MRELDYGAVFARLHPKARSVAEVYQVELAACHALDFADLIWLTAWGFS